MQNGMNLHPGQPLLEIAGIFAASRIRKAGMFTANIKIQCLRESGVTLKRPLKGESSKPRCNNREIIIAATNMMFVRNNPVKTGWFEWMEYATDNWKTIVAVKAIVRAVSSPASRIFME